jgi:hypothetical protein
MSPLKAVEIDPSYGKAWARLASSYLVSSWDVVQTLYSRTNLLSMALQSLGAIDKSIEAWDKAIRTFSVKETLTDAEKKVKQEYESGLRAARDKKMGKGPIVVPASTAQSKKMPWERADALAPELEAAANNQSSVSISFMCV